MGYEDEKYFEAFIAHFQKTIQMTFKREIDFMLQIELEWTDNSVSLSQNSQIESLKKKFNVCVFLNEFSQHPWKQSLSLQREMQTIYPMYHTNISESPSSPPSEVHI